ncbi:hypothetical protein AABM34_04205 [Lysinibacillus fusiformis]
MERRKQLRKYIQRAKSSLTFEKSIPIAQYGLFLALLSSASLVLISRLFVWYSIIAKLRWLSLLRF